MQVKFIAGAVLLVVSFASAAHARPPASAVSEARASRFGLDYVFPLAERYDDPVLTARLAAIGAGWVDFHEVSWARIEPAPPKEGRHRYDWGALDRVVALWQRHGKEIVLTLRMQQGWFSGPRRYEPRLGLLSWIAYRHSDRLPAVAHVPDYRAWIRALVERYDGDGEADMPGLRSPVLHLQVGNEYCNPMFWTGTIDDYARFLRLTREAAREACPDVKIVSNGIRWNDLFANDPQGRRFEARFAASLARLPNDVWRKAWRRMRAFTERTVALAGDYDILDGGGNGPYHTMSRGYMRWIRSTLEAAGARTRVWDLESRCEPQLQAPAHCLFLPETTLIPGGKELLSILRRPKHPRHGAAMAWYRDEQSRELVRVFVTRFAAGFEKVFMGMVDDWDGTWGAWSTPNPFLGVLSSEGRPWPAYRAFRQIVRLLDGFSQARFVKAPSGVALHRFDFPEGRRSVWVAWLAQKRAPQAWAAPLRKGATLPAIEGPVTVRTVPLTGRPAGLWRQGKAGEALRIELDTTPVYIQSDR